MSDTLIEKTDKAIQELVYPKYNLQKAYNYYNGERDEEQFKYLQEVYGVGSPTSVEFTPLIKKHVDALIGEYLGTPIIPKVTCKDTNTLSAITREKELKISKDVLNFLKQHLKNSLLTLQEGKDITDKKIQEQINKVQEESGRNFISSYEEAAQNVVEYLMQSRKIDFTNSLRTLLLDLLITGYTFYRVKPSSTKTNVTLEILNPLNTFIDANPESPYIKDSYRAVVRKWYTASQIISLYGEKLSAEDKANIKEEFEKYGGEYGVYYVRNRENVGVKNNGGDKRTPTEPGFPSGETVSYDSRLIPVYEVEWLEVDDDLTMQRYETVRIGDNKSIYITNGKNDKVIRSKDNPKECSLSINGVIFRNRGNQPYSLVRACQHLQDKYDLLNFYKDNLIANSGTVGDWIDETLIPAHLGANMPERLQKWISYKKNGIALLDSSQEGRLASGQAPINTIFNGYDDTLKGQAIQSIEIAIQSIEQTTSSITGVFRERLNGIQERDAVTNVQASMNNSYTITKQYYHQMDLITIEMLLDMLNTAKVVYKKGLSGNIILGDKKQKIFTALPEKFTLTDYDIHVTTSSDVIREMEQIRALIPQLVQSKMVDPSIIVEAMMSRSLSELKEIVTAAITKQKAENDQLMQLSQQNEQLVQQNEQLKNDVSKMQTKLEQLNETKLAIDKEKAKVEAEIAWFNAETDRKFKEDSIKVDKQRVELELAQKYDGNPYNDQIRQ